MKPKAQVKITRTSNRSMNGGIMLSFAIIFKTPFLLTSLTSPPSNGNVLAGDKRDFLIYVAHLSMEGVRDGDVL
jgi:hypothetical protein